MEGADFSGWATKAGLECSDGRTIMDAAFKHQDGLKVPLVWQHAHGEPTNILGHAILENRAGEGVYAYGFFNNTPEAQHAKESVRHGDIDALSIYANKLKERAKQVFHGMIKEVSLVISGANPGAFIDNVNLAHSDEPSDEAEIFTGLTLEYVSSEDFAHSDDTADPDEPKEEPVTTTDSEVVTTTDSDDSDESVVQHAAGDEETIQDVYNSFSEKQKNVVHFMIGAALEQAAESAAAHSDEDETDDSNLEHSATETSNTVEHSDTTNTGEGDLTHQEGTSMNVFDKTGAASEGKTLSHDDLVTINNAAQRDKGSFKEAFLAHAQNYGIENIDILFPDAKAVANNPDVIGRRQEWVADVLNSTTHSPFSRIKSRAVDLTADEARAKGYVKGNLKKDEIVRLLKRVTTPTTIYKKQKLDRDDVVDIVDLDVVAWLKAEMRVMLDEEVARAVLVGDGREADDEDKINPDHVRPIAYDNDMYAHQLVVASELSGEAVIEAILRARTYYKGTGTPKFYTTDRILTDLILLKDKMGRRLYRTEADLAAELRVASIVTVEVMEDTPDVVGIVVNLADYTIGADRGGNVGMFDDFDIDYNQYKYLIETRISGALTKPKSALVVKRTLGTVVAPTSPSFNGATDTVTYPSIAGVVYTVDGTPQTGSVVLDETTDVEARPATGYSFPPNTNRNWTFVVTG